MKLSKQQNILSLGFWLVLIFIALVIYKDYGISWDEPTQRRIGMAAYHYIHEGDPQYLQMKDRVYGVGMELPLIYIEKCLGFNDLLLVYQTRHLLNFFLFSFACFLFFRLCLKIFQNTWVACILVLMLVLMPRIFAHAFFNSKDLPFMSMLMISFYMLHRYLHHPVFWKLISMSVCVGLLINFRIMGILFLVTSAGILLLKLITTHQTKYLTHLLILLLLSGLVLYICWPYLWNDPWENFMNAFRTMSKFPYDSDMLFRGEKIRTGTHRFNYLFTWIGITIPLVYLVSAIVGLFFFVTKLFRSNLAFLTDPNLLMGICILIHLVVPIAMIFYFHSTLYDEWRQLFFIYPSFIFMGGYAMKRLIMCRKMFRFVRIGMGIYGCWIIIQMIILHPYENVYFNELVPRRKNYILTHFEQDYWATSFREGVTFLSTYRSLEKIVMLDPYDLVKRNVELLPQNSQKRFSFSPDVKDATCYMTTLRGDKDDWVGRTYFKEIIFEVRRQNSIILRIWKK